MEGMYDQHNHPSAALVCAGTQVLHDIGEPSLTWLVVCVGI